MGKLVISRSLENLLGRPISIADLVASHQDLFDRQQAGDLTHQVFTKRRFLDRSIINQYSAAEEVGKLDFARSHNLHDDDIKFTLFPLPEVLAWWIAYTIYHGNQHGMRSYVTPTSTFIEGERLGVAFLVNEYLRVAYTFVAREAVHPRNQIWPPIKW